MNIPAVVPPVAVYLERKLRERITAAKLVCKGYEDTKECRVAWDQVESYQKAIHVFKHRHQKKTDPLCEDDELACREYDV